MKTKVAFKKWYRNGWASPFAGLTALWTWGKYSHTELMINHQRGFSASAWDNEVRVKEIDFYNGKWDIVETDREIDFGYVESVLGNDYDYIGIVFSELLPLHLHIKNRFYCSETVACALGFTKCQKDPVKLHKTLLTETYITPYTQKKQDEAFDELAKKLLEE